MLVIDDETARKIASAKDSLAECQKELRKFWSLFRKAFPNMEVPNNEYTAKE